MARYAPKRYWTQQELDELRELVAMCVPTWQIARNLDRSPLAIRLKASRLKLPLAEYSDRAVTARRGPMARVGSPRLAVNFDLSALSHGERLILFRRLIEATPGLAAVAQEIITQVEKDRAKAYDASAAATERNNRRVAEWRANRAKLGWDKQRPK